MAKADVIEAPRDWTLLNEFWQDFRQSRGAVIGLSLVLFFVLVAILAPYISPYNPAQIFGDATRVPPFWSENGSARFLLGTDDLGRDLLSRLIYGARVSMGVGALAVTMSVTIGTFLGLLAGYHGGWIDQTIMRGVDIMMSLPSILLAIVVVAVLGPGLFNAIIAVSIVSIPSFVRLVRGSAMTERPKQYVLASKSFGASHTRQMMINILPNCMAPIIVQGSLGFSDAILNAAALGFLGIGAQPPTPEWGTMLSDSRPFIESAPYLVTLPGLCILIVVLAFNLFGDGLRDALDPRLKQ